MYYVDSLHILMQVNQLFSLAKLLICLLIHSSTHSLYSDLLIRSLTHSYSLPPSLTYSLTHSYTHTLTHSHTHIFTHSLTHTLTHSLTHTPHIHPSTHTHSLTLFTYTHSLTHSTHFPSTAVGTIAGLRAELTQAIQVLIQARTSTVSVSSGCELFLRFITMTSLDQNVREVKKTRPLQERGGQHIV